MTLKPDSFKKMRLKAMELRKTRILKNTNSEVTTLNKIAEKLKRTSMVNGKCLIVIGNYYVVSRGRTAALLAGNKSKKRRLNEFMGEEDIPEDNEAEALKK